LEKTVKGFEERIMAEVTWQITNKTKLFEFKMSMLSISTTVYNSVIELHNRCKYSKSNASYTVCDKVYLMKL